MVGFYSFFNSNVLRFFRVVHQSLSHHATHGGNLLALSCLVDHLLVRVKYSAELERAYSHLLVAEHSMHYLYNSFQCSAEYYLQPCFVVHIGFPYHPEAEHHNLSFLMLEWCLSRELSVFAFLHSKDNLGLLAHLLSLILYHAAFSYRDAHQSRPEVELLSD